MRGMGPAGKYLARQEWCISRLQFPYRTQHIVLKHRMHGSWTHLFIRNLIGNSQQSWATHRLAPTTLDVKRNVSAIFTTLLLLRVS